MLLIKRDMNYFLVKPFIAVIACLLSAASSFASATFLQVSNSGTS